MIPLLHRTRVTGSIVSCTIASDTDKIFMMDNLFHFYELDTEDLSFTKSVQLLKDIKGRHKFTRSLSTSAQGYLFISPSKSSTGVVLRDNKTVIKIASLKWHKPLVHHNFPQMDNISPQVAKMAKLLYSSSQASSLLALYPHVQIISRLLCLTKQTKKLHRQALMV